MHHPRSVVGPAPRRAVNWRRAGVAWSRVAAPARGARRPGRRPARRPGTSAPTWCPTCPAPPGHDPNLVNAWGIASARPRRSGSRQRTDVSTLYTGDVGGAPPVRRAAGGDDPRRRADRPGVQPDARLHGAPTARHGPAVFIFASEAGQHHRLEPDRAGRHRRAAAGGPRTPDAVYKGLAMAQQRQRQLPLRRRLPQRQDRRLRRHFHPVTLAGIVHRPEPAGRLRPVQHRRTSAASCTSPTPSRTPTPRTTWPARATASSTSSPRRPLVQPAGRRTAR